MNNEQTPLKKLSQLRAWLMPIHNHELKKFIPMALMMVCILFNYTVLRATKDAMIATAPVAGVETIPYLKSVFVMLTATLFVVAYTKLSNVFSFSKIFYGCNFTFLIFFLSFAFLLHPNCENLHPSSEYTQNLQAQFPRLKFLFSVWGVWTYSLFYIMAEMWGNIMIPLLFWQFANQVVDLSQAKRFYPMFILFGNMALVLSGSSLKFACNPELCQGLFTTWEESLNLLMVLISLMILISISSFYWVNSRVLNAELHEERVAIRSKQKKFKMSVLESFQFIFTNRYLALIALLILSYSISVNLIELMWKKQIAIWYKGDTQGYNTFMGQYVMWSGIATIVIAFMTKEFIGKFGWLSGALSTPIVLSITGILFFFFLLAHDLMMPLLTLVTIPATYAAMNVGMAQSILTRSIKYTLFDTSKEMAYIPLDDEVKAKGKAVVDILGARLGKTLGSWVVLTLFYLLAVQDIMDILPYMAMIIGLVMVCWISCVIRLNASFIRIKDACDESSNLKGTPASELTPTST